MEKRNQGSYITSANTLVLIPVNGSKEHESLSVLLTLGDKPLLFRAIDTARELAPHIEVCVSSDNMDVIRSVRDYGLHVPFKLPRQLSANVPDIDEIMLHAIDHYARKEINFDNIVMLSPYSPFCDARYVHEAATLMTKDTEMVASVKVLNGVANSYYLTENNMGYLDKHKDKSALNGADLYSYNKSFFILKTSAIRQYPRAFFSKIRKYVMSDEASFYINDAEDIKRCEILLKRKDDDRPLD